ncbi:hypothetical protein C0Q70_13667 [Pomacea canaliculata]|uniref:Uncharacterized protein n=1 Tax=Pomacea canaliculata TaxID=400727 RepID=A0A2T7NXV7_POMCA|nr:hypothetical protein C0Q70_13667 [Pomacea canaliculata]
MRRRDEGRLKDRRETPCRHVMYISCGLHNTVYIPRVQIEQRSADKESSKKKWSEHEFPLKEKRREQRRTSVDRSDPNRSFP